MSIKSSQKLVQEANENIESLSAKEIKSLVEKNEVTLIDVRDIRELWKEGTIKGSKHIPRGMLEFWLDPESSYYQENKIKDFWNLDGPKDLSDEWVGHTKFTIRRHG